MVDISRFLQHQQDILIYQRKSAGGSMLLILPVMFQLVMFPPVIFCAITGGVIITALSATITATIMKICFEYVAYINWVYYI